MTTTKNLAKLANALRLEANAVECLATAARVFARESSNVNMILLRAAAKKATNATHAVGRLTKHAKEVR